MSEYMTRKDEQIALLIRENKALKAALRLDKPWPIQNVLRRLADGADHLLDVHNCDGHGHEELKACKEHARSMADQIDQALSGCDNPGCRMNTRLVNDSFCLHCRRKLDEHTALNGTGDKG